MRPLDDNNPELPEVRPLLFALVRAVILVILPELAHDRRLAVAVMTDLRTLHFEEVEKGVFAFGLRGVGDREHRVGRHGAFQVRLLPMQF